MDLNGRNIAIYLGVGASMALIVAGIALITGTIKAAA